MNKAAQLLLNKFRRLYGGLLLFLALLPAHANGLPDSVSLALQKVGIPRDAVSVVIQPTGSGVPLLSLNAEQPMNPASTMKLVTTYAALESLGPAYTWKTALWAGGEIHDGTLQGDLIIRGGGDPYMTLERLWLLQRALRQKGVREINGNLLLDLSLYELPPSDVGAFDGDPLAGHNAVPSPLVVNFNVQNVKLLPEGEAVSIKAEMPLTGIRFTSRLRLTELPCNGWRSQVKAGIPDPGVGEVVFDGSYPRSCGEKSMALNLFEPPLNFAQTFRALWEESGGKWQGGVAPGMAPADAPLLEFESPPLADVIRPLNKYSSNIMTRMVYLTLGQTKSGAPATLDKSAIAVRETLAAKDLNFPELVLENGAGLSRLERISAHSMSRLLQAASRSRNFSELESSLPIAAVDGTMKNRLNGNVNGSPSGAAGHAHLKTGSLKDVKSLAGYVRDKNGQNWVVVFMINHANAGRGTEAQDALIEWLYQGAAFSDGQPRT